MKKFVSIILLVNSLVAGAQNEAFLKEFETVKPECYDKANEDFSKPLHQNKTKDKAQSSSKKCE